MSIQQLGQIEESDHGGELWFDGSGCGLLTVGEWSAGGCKQSINDWIELQKQAQLIAKSPELMEVIKEMLSTAEWDQYGRCSQESKVRARKLLGSLGYES